MLAVDPSLYHEVEGSTDSEAFFFLALTLGLEDDPPGALARAVGMIEHVGRKHGIEHPIQMTVATSDGDRVWGFRYSSEGKSRSLFFSTRVDTLRESTLTTPSSTGSRTRPGSSCRSRSATSREPGTRCPSRASG